MVPEIIKSIMDEFSCELRVHYAPPAMVIRSGRSKILIYNPSLFSWVVLETDGAVLHVMRSIDHTKIIDTFELSDPKCFERAIELLSQYV